MKKCKFCSHSGVTEQGEQVCTKYLVYVGDDVEDIPCSGFEFNLSSKRIVIAAAVIFLAVILIIFGS